MGERREQDAVRAVDWSLYPGAYGTSRDVPAALETLRAGPDGGDDFEDAVNDFLWGHVWHQGTIYPLTPKVLPFLLDVLEPRDRDARGAHGDSAGNEGGDPLDPERAAELADVVMCSAASARRLANDAASDAERAIATEVLGVVAANRSRLGRLVGFDSPRIVATMLCVPALAAELMAGRDPAHERRAVLCAVLAAMPLVTFDAEVRAWTCRELDAIGHPVTTAAAALLSRGAGSSDGERFAQIGIGLGLERQDVAQRDVWLDGLRERFGILVPRPSFTASGTTTATVATMDDDWFVVAPGGTRITVRWPRHPFREDDVVELVDRNARNIPREVRGTGEKAHHRATFDDSGKVTSSSA